MLIATPGLIVALALHQGTASAVPNVEIEGSGFSPCMAAPRGLKPDLFWPFFGTTEVVP
jgi:hypothetical protein